MVENGRRLKKSTGSSTQYRLLTLVCQPTQIQHRLIVYFAAMQCFDLFCRSFLQLQRRASAPKGRPDCTSPTAMIGFPLAARHCSPQGGDARQAFEVISSPGGLCTLIFSRCFVIAAFAGPSGLCSRCSWCSSAQARHGLSAARRSPNRRPHAQRHRPPRGPQRPPHTRPPRRPGRRFPPPHPRRPLCPRRYRYRQQPSCPP